MIVVTHAFSRRNAGDGLLVSLTLDLLRRVGVKDSEMRLLALDAASFREPVEVRQVPGEPWGRMSAGLLKGGAEVAAAAAAAVSGGRIGHTKLAQMIEGASAIVGIGGGYLRTPSVVESVGCLVNHVPQLGAAASGDAPSIYLPQSVGPLPGPVGAIVRRLLARIGTVCVRDDESLALLGDSPNVRRLPDLAVLSLAEKGPRPVKASLGRPVITARPLAAAPGYASRLRALHGAIGPARVAVQAAGAGGRSDVNLYRELGWSPEGSLPQILRDQEPGVVVSVRLHGAMLALLAGWPAIHLAYDRKGWGAYGDLGLARYVHDARRFDPHEVAGQAIALAEDPGPLWDSISERLPALVEDGRALERAVARTIGA